MFVNVCECVFVYTYELCAFVSVCMCVVVHTCDCVCQDGSADCRCRLATFRHPEKGIFFPIMHGTTGENLFQALCPGNWARLRA